MLDHDSATFGNLTHVLTLCWCRQCISTSSITSRVWLIILPSTFGSATWKMQYSCYFQNPKKLCKSWWKLCALRHGIQNSVEAIFCMPPRSDHRTTGWGQFHVSYDMLSQAPLCTIVFCTSIAPWFEACGIARFVTIPKGFCACWLCWSGLISLHCAAAPVHWVPSTGGATWMLKSHSLFERCVTLPVGTWSVTRKQSIRSVGGHVRNLTTLYFKRKETKFVGNKTAIYIEIALLYVFSTPNSLVFVSFLRLSDRSHDARASREHAFDASGSAMPEPQQTRQWEGANVRQKNPLPQTLRSPKIRERLVVKPRSTARTCRRMSSYGRVLAPSSRVLAARSEPVYFFFVQTLCRFRSKFAWALPLSLSWTMTFFSATTNKDKKWKLVPNARLPW